MNNFNRPFIYLYSLLFCLRYLPFSTALRIPILVWPFSLKVKGLRKRDIAFSAPIRHGMVVVGFPGTEGRSARKSLISVTDDVRIVFGDNVTLARGTQLVIKGHELSIGNNFFCNGDCFFTCDDDIRIGDNCLFGWDIDLNTNDGHRVMIEGEWRKSAGPIVLGNHIWVCSESHISKNVTLADGCVVAQRSLVNKSCSIPKTLLGGMPARALRTNVEWEK